jgi:hypothetical protein
MQHDDMPLYTKDGRRATIVDRREHERLWAEQEWADIRKQERALRLRRRQLRQLRDVRSMEGR